MHQRTLYCILYSVLPTYFCCVCVRASILPQPKNSACIYVFVIFIIVVVVTLICIFRFRQPALFSIAKRNYRHRDRKKNVRPYCQTNQSYSLVVPPFFFSFFISKFLGSNFFVQVDNISVVLRVCAKIQFSNENQERIDACI